METNPTHLERAAVALAWLRDVFTERREHQVAAIIHTRLIETVNERDAARLASQRIEDMVRYGVTTEPLEIPVAWIEPDDDPAS